MSPHGEYMFATTRWVSSNEKPARVYFYLCVQRARMGRAFSLRVASTFQYRAYLSRYEDHRSP